MKWLISILLTLQTTSTVLIHPPIPKSTQVAIVVLKQPQSEQQIKQIITPYKDVKLRRIFREALDGFSIEGSPEAILRLSQQQRILAVSPVAKYRAESEEGVKIIGGEEVRRIFDHNNQRLTGKGITVGVIDTGVDYTHPDLKSNYAGGHDLVDNDRDPMETLAVGKATIHGTHVAGIIAANGKIKGVAPEAKIVAYRALGPGGGGTTEQVLAAIEQAIKDKVDVVNLSLGNDINGPDLPISLALNRAVDKGIVAVAASGNSGPDVWTVGSPGTSSKAISVGASTPTMEIPSLIIEGSRKKIRVQPLEGSANWGLDRSLELADGGLGRKEDLHDVQGKMVLIKRGTITFTEKAKNAFEAGAKAVLIYNNLSGSFMGNLDAPMTIPVGALALGDGVILQKRLKEHSVAARVLISEERDRLADFSSRGPVTGTWEIKPDIVAPGVSINSTIPGGYLSLQGTSMAAPHVAGACALIKQAHPEWTPAQIKAALMNTAKPIGPNSNALYRTYEQGAGRIQVDDAIQTTSLVSPSSLRFGKYTEENNSHKAILKIENTGEKTQRYSFKIPYRVEGVSWRFPLSFTLGSRESKEITIELQIDPQVFKRKIHDGFLQLEAGSELIQIPYLYVLEEPGYPRVMGFDFAYGDRPGEYRYEVYLPGGAEEFGIALFNPEDYRFVGFLDTETNVKKGQLRKIIPKEQLPASGTYLVKVFAKKAGKEDFIEKMIMIEKKDE
ncbi:minor extracellular serine protease Vpr [Neobacillus bataviensis]|uniref:Minor extracellular serine protease Vpr n=1 Tax=Neobacillus bataviensis TaxID=220685 RepID=A0A561D8Q1_9BACI|nr:S8 family serine peptidase [Neobacillus bataviensis]TWD99478.1 minor extracellular serine protease Vpr [Neobacillus bataviensis]